jgi:integrase
MARDNLEQRGRQHYLRLAIPRSIRKYFLSSKGKPMAHIVEPLGDSYEVAKILAAERVAVCMNIFGRVKAGIITTPEQVKAALEPREPDEPDVKLHPKHELALRRWYDERPAAPGDRGPWLERYAELLDRVLSGEQAAPAAPAVGHGETVSQAAEAWYAELMRDKSTAPRETTLDGHKRRVQAFINAVGDVPLTAVTRAAASGFLAGLDVGSNRTRNAYATTLKCVFECARRRGRFTGDDPFDGMKAKVAGTSYQPFTVAELQKLFDAMPRETKPKRHTPDTALPWVALMALYTGMRLEEIAQLTTADIRKENANGATVWCVDVHNGGENKLKNETSERLIPIHSELVRLGLLGYVKALPKGPLFPGLVRRESKGGKVGARLGELFRKKLVALDIKREGLCFHSFRHSVAGRLDAAAVPQSDAARVLGHAVAGMSYGTYSQAGPGLKRVAATVEQITYEGLRL